MYYFFGTIFTAENAESAETAEEIFGHEKEPQIAQINMLFYHEDTKSHEDFFSHRGHRAHREQSALCARYNQFSKYDLCDW